VTGIMPLRHRPLAITRALALAAAAAPTYWIG
jgi:hypothetical protein